jgi:predicted PurR-regulated permease PerM
MSDDVRGPIGRVRVGAFRRGRAADLLAPWIIVAIATTALYAGQSVLLPIILAILLSFLLAPIVAGFRRLRVPRVPATLLAIALALATIAMSSAIIISQAATLTKDAPAYAERITAKAATLRVGIRERFGSVLETRGGSGHRDARNARRAGYEAMTRSGDGLAIPVEVRQPPPSAVDEIRSYVIPALKPIETTLIVIIVTIFILFQKEDLRDRLIRLMGTGDIHRTTVALDEGARRLSRYFLSQFIVNLGFGAVVWAGLFAIGVPSPGLWGALAGLLRFVPYVGVFVAALGPLALAAAVDPGWLLVAYVVLLFLIVEPIVGYVVEPLLYGHSTGLSPVSVVVAALFWTWIWGPIGLVLSMPLTLMLVVLGRHIPTFEIFDIVLGDRPALSPSETFYQRVLAGHPEDLVEQAELHLETMTLSAYYDEVVLGGLRLAAADVDRGVVERSALNAVCDTTMDVLAALEDYRPSPVAGTALTSVEQAKPGASDACGDLAGPSIFCVPGRGPLDRAVARMTAQVLRRAGCEVHEQVREPGRTPDFAGSSVTAGSFICILGLFDERSHRRMQPVLAHLAAGSPAATVLLGVMRTDEHSPEPAENRPFRSINALCRTISVAA